MQKRKPVTTERGTALSSNPPAGGGSWLAGGLRLCDFLTWVASEVGGTDKTTASDSDSESHGDNVTSAPGLDLAGTRKSRV